MHVSDRSAGAGEGKGYRQEAARDRQEGGAEPGGLHRQWRFQGPDARRRPPGAVFACVREAANTRSRVAHTDSGAGAGGDLQPRGRRHAEGTPQRHAKESRGGALYAARSLVNDIIFLWTYIRIAFQRLTSGASGDEEDDRRGDTRRQEDDDSVRAEPRGARAAHHRGLPGPRRPVR